MVPLIPVGQLQESFALGDGCSVSWPLAYGICLESVLSPMLFIV